MRTLNRPMFRYGGPIKEGIMSGIREPRQNYQSGQLVKPGPGRPGYQGNPYSTNYNLIDWKNANKPYRPINIQSISEVGSSPSNATKIQKAKNLLKSSKFSERGIYDALKKYIPKAWGGIKAGTRFGLQRFPLITTGVAGEYLTRPRDIDKLVYEQEDYGPWEGRLRKILDPTYNKKWIEAAKKYDFDKKSALGKDEKDKVTETNPWKEKYEALVEENKVPKKSDEEIRAERIQKYRDIMDIKGMNKQAAYKSLVDASKAVGESGDFKGDIKSGKLINQIIQSTSKAYDKPADMKKAIDTLILKGEIQKDIAGAKPSQYEIKEDYLTGNLGAVIGKRVSLQKPGTLSDALLLTKGTDTKTNRTSQALRSYFDGYLTPKFEGIISSDKIKKLGGKEKLIEGESISLDNGVYQVSKGYILVEDNKIIKQEDLFTGKD